MIHGRSLIGQTQPSVTEKAKENRDLPRVTVTWLSIKQCSYQ